MNTLNGYSKSTLSDKYVLTAAGGHRLIYDSEFIVGTQTVATGNWTGVTTDSELYDGKLISYWLPCGGKDYATLNLTLAGGSTTGAVNCYYGDATRITTHFAPNRIVRLTYRKNVKIGSNTYTGWWADASYNDGNYYTTAYCYSKAAEPAKLAYCTNYVLQSYSYVPVLMRYSNSSASAITLNINSTGDKPIYINGVASSASHYTLPAGLYIAYYDGSCYQIRTDGILPGKIQDSVTVNGHTVKSDVPEDAKFTDTTYSVMKGATSTAAGTSGLVPAPAANKHNMFLKGDGTWASPENTTYHTMTGATYEADGTAGLVPKPVIANRNQYLKGDGTWATPTNTTYSTMSQAEATEGTKTDGRLITAAVLRTTISNAISGKLDSSTASSTYATKTELTDGLNKKVDKVSGKGLSTNDYTTDEKNKLAGIAAGAEVNQNAFAKISDGTTTIVADAKQDTLNVVAGSGIGLALDADKDQLTVLHADTSALSGAYGPTANVTGSNGATISVPEITVDTFGHVIGVINRTYTSKDTTYSAITADELSAGTATTSRVVTAKVLGPWVKSQIDTKIAAADAMIYKGTLGANGTITELPNTTAKTGWTYKVITAGTYADVKCEIGDMIICLTDGSSSTNATWTVVQNNIDGAVIGPASSTDNHVAVFSGTSGKVIKNSGFTIGKSVPSNALFTDTNTKVNITLGTTTKAYLLGTSITPTSTALGVTAIADTNVYLDDTEGSLTAKVFKGALAGNALTADKLATSKTLTIGKTGKTFDGSEDVSWTLAEIGAAATSHGTHVTYSTTAPLANGTASPGTANNVSRGDHVHPLQTTVSGNAGTATALKTARTIDGVLFDGSVNITHYAECETDKDTAAKTISLTNFRLEKGAKIVIRFAVTNNAANPTLNVNNTGAKAIYYRGSAIGYWRLVAKKLYSLVYDGTNWEVIGDLDTDTYTSAYCSTGKSTAAKIATCTNYVLTDNTYTHITTAYANEVQGELTLNINSKGAKPIYINGTISSSSNYILPAGTYIVYYDGSAYHFRTDGVIPGKVKDATTVNGLTVQTAVPKNAVFTDTKLFTITANANDDDVIVLSGTNGTNAVSYTATHAKTFGNNTEPYTVKYSSGNTVTSITGSGASGTIKIPQITVDEYGHVRYGADESVSITMPTLPTTLKNPKALKFGNKTYDGSSETTLTSTDLGIIAHATCSTDKATAAKVITLKNNFNWELRPGHIIVVTFDQTNTASNPTFNVNNTGAKSVWYNSAVITTSSLSMAGTANRPMMFMYDGAQYVFMGWSYDANNTYSTYTLGIGYGTCSTATGITDKVVTLANYLLVKGGIISVKFDNAVDAASSMNINTKGAKSIYYRGSAIVGGIIPAGAIATFIYDGTYYHLIGLDAPRVSISRNLTSGTKIGTITIDNLSTDLYCHTNTDTKNTAGSTNSTEKLFLIGATTQAANPTTYSNSGVFAANGTLSAAAFISGAGTSDFTAGTVKFDTLNIPTSSNGTTFGAGSNGLFLKSNGTSVYWGWDNNTWRALQVNGTEIANTGTGTYPLNFVSGTGISVSGVAGTTETKLNKITITNTGVRSVTIGTGDNANKLAVNTNGLTTNLTIPYSTKSTHLVGGAAGNIVYLSDANTTAFLANPTTNGYVLKFNTSTGLPYWSSDTNYYRPISVGGTSILGNNNTALNLVAGTNISLTPEKSGSNYTGKVTIAAPNVTPVTQSIPYIIGPDTDTTAGTWTGSYSKITAYTEGLTIMYVPKVAGSLTATTLNINGLGALTCYLKGSSKLTTHFAANSVVVLTYRENVVISDKTYTGWWANSLYDSDIYYYQLLAYTSVTAGTNGIKQYSLMLEDADGNRQSLTTSSGAGTSKVKNPVGFKLGSKVLFYSGSSDLAAGTNTNEWTAYSAYLINFKYSSNCNATLEARKMVYLIGTVSNGLFYLDDAIYTLTPNNTSKVYIPLGYARTNGYQIDFDNVYDPVVYEGSTLVPYAGNFFKVNARTTVGTGDIYLELWRGSNASWKILNSLGDLKFQSNYTTTTGNYFDVLKLEYNTGNATIKGVTSVDKLIIRSTASSTKHLEFSRGSYNYISAPSGGSIVILPNGVSASSSTGMSFTSTGLVSQTNNNYSLGTSSLRWANIYSNLGNFSGLITASGGIEATNNIILSVSDNGDTPQLIFQRGTTSDGYYDWRVYNTGGYLKFLYNSSGSWYNTVSIYSTGINSSAFIKSGSSDEYVLLGGGGHKTLASFEASYDEKYVLKSGDIMTGLLTTSTGNNLGIKIGKTNITTTGSSSGDIIVQSNNAIRFGVDAWSYDKWAGLKYDHSNKTVYLGIADGTIFTANTNLSGGRLFLPGISNAYIGNGWYTILHSNNYTSYTVKTVSGTVSGAAVKYVKLGTLPASSESTYDSFVITGSVGGFSSDSKSHINVQVSRRNGVNYRGSVQQVNTDTWDIGVNSSGEIFLIFSGAYCAYTVSMHTVGGTISYSTSATPKDTTWTLLSNSSNISVYNKLGIIDKANNGVFYIEGTGTTDGVWLGSHSGITSYYKGLTIAYKIPRAGTSKDPYTTLNINGLGAKNCYINASRVTTHYPKDAVVVFVYDGTYFRAYNYSDGNTYTSAYCLTKADDAAKAASCTGYTATENTYIHVTIVNANTAASALTLNINSKGAKPVYINGSASSATNYTLPAGTYMVYYNGTNYYFKTNGILPGKIEYATSASYLVTQDTRNNTNAPTDFGPCFRGDFKANGKNNMSDGGSFYGLLHFRPYGSYSDFSGGYPHLLAFTENSNIWHRKAKSSTEWNEWNKLAFITEAVPLVKGTQTAITGTWTGNCPLLTSLVEGLTIKYWLPFKGNGNATLNLTLANGVTTGDINCYYSGTSRLTTHFGANTLIVLTYQTVTINEISYTGWWVNALYNTDTNLNAVSWTAGQYAAKTASCSNYILKANSYLYVVMNYDNTYEGELTLNVASNGAKPIYINGSKSSSTNYTLPKGGYVTYYNGTNYYFRTDGILPGSIELASKVTCTQGTGDSYRPVVVTTLDNRIFYGTKVTANYLTGDLKASSVTINTLNAPTSNGSTTLGPGANGQVLKSNGTSVYWATDNLRSITDSYTGTSTSIAFSLKGANNLYKNFINQSIPYIVGPSTDAEGVWTGTHSGITAYVDGLTIMYVPGVKGKSPTTLNINELGAKTCHYTNSSTINLHYAVGTPILFTYINGYWKRADYAENTYLDAVSWTASGTAAKGASCSNYILTAKSYLYVVMNYDNTYAGAITLNVASKGAKPIYINGSASSATNCTLPKGGYMTYYDGTNYHFRTDGILPGSIDMLDGYHASSFNLRSLTYVSSTTKVGYINNTEIRALAGTDITDVNDFPTINTDGIRLIYNTYPKTASNIPTSPNGANALLTLIKGNYNTTTSYGSLLAFPNDGKIYSRVLSAGAFGTWQLIAFKSDIPSFGAKGSATKGIYLSAANTFAEMTYSLNATVNAGTANKLAYYSGANTIDDYTDTVGSSVLPMYLNAGVPTACDVPMVRYWARYTISMYSGIGAYTKYSGNHNFISAITTNTTGKVSLTVSCPTGWTLYKTMIFGNGFCAVSGSNSDPETTIYPTIWITSDVLHGTVVLHMSDDASRNNGVCWLQFLCIG